MIDVISDLDESGGGRIERPGFQAALARCEAGDAKGVIVAKLESLRAVASRRCRYKTQQRVLGHSVYNTLAAIAECLKMLTDAGETIEVEADELANDA